MGTQTTLQWLRENQKLAILGPAAFLLVMIIGHQAMQIPWFAFAFVIAVTLAIYISVYVQWKKWRS